MLGIRIPVLALAALVAALTLSSSALADSPPTAPRGTSRITMVQTFEGVPIMVPTTRPAFAHVNGSLCERDPGTEVLNTISLVVSWPWRDVRPCNEIGTSVQICATHCTELFTFQGWDLQLEIPVPDAALTSRRTSFAMARRCL